MVGGAARDMLAGLASCSVGPMGKTGRSRGLWPVTSLYLPSPAPLAASVALGRRITPDVQPHSLAPHALSACRQWRMLCPCAALPRPLPPGHHQHNETAVVCSCLRHAAAAASERGTIGAIFDPRLSLHRGCLDAVGSWIICISSTISLKRQMCLLNA